MRVVYFACALLAFVAPVRAAELLGSLGTPENLIFAGPGDCGSAAVAAAVGGSVDVCRARLSDGAIVASWDPAPCSGSACGSIGFRLYNASPKSLVREVPGTSRSVLIVGARLGDCYTVRAFGFGSESTDSIVSCVTKLTTTHHASYGPSESGEFRGVVHDNADADWCTRRSWDTSWSGEPWGFVTHTNVLKTDPNAPSAATSFTVGSFAQTHPGTKPFPCPEGLVQVWRSYAFVLPPDAASGLSSAVLAFDPVGKSGDLTTCFRYLWNAHRWTYRGANSSSALIGLDDGRMLDHDATPLATVQFADGKANVDLSGNAALKNGALTVEFALAQDGFDTNEAAHPSLHQGKYLSSPGSNLCSVRNPHLDVAYVTTQTSISPLAPLIRGAEGRRHPVFGGTPAPEIFIPHPAATPH
jgi:hypothetical protein